MLKMRSKILLPFFLYRPVKNICLFNSFPISRRCHHFSAEFQPSRSFWNGLNISIHNVSDTSSGFTSHMLRSYCSTNSSQDTKNKSGLDYGHISDEIEPIDTWEEEDEAEAKIGDGGDGGGLLFQNCAWADRALSIANEVLPQLGDDIKLFAFKTSPRGYIYVRLDKLSNEYGCPGMEELESFSQLYKAKLDKVGETGDVPSDLALEVSSPGAERLLKVPDDLHRFKDMIMRVDYVENSDLQCPIKNGVFLLESVEPESSSCTWRLADVKENRDPAAKGRPLSRKQKDWRLRLPYDMFKRVLFHPFSPHAHILGNETEAPSFFT